MNTLKTNFVNGNILTAEQLMTLVDKINELINNLPQSTTPSEGSGDEIPENILQQLDELNITINEMLNQLNGDGDEEGIKSGIVKLKNAIGLIIANFGEDNQAVNRAAIIASINENNTSTVGISADKVIVKGDASVIGNMTLTGKLISLDAAIENLTANQANINSATIKNAIIDDIEAGDITINGTLHYNKIVGNVETVNSNTTLSNDSYFVRYTGTDYSSPHPTITFPINPTLGQTLFIEIGNRQFDIKANRPIVVYTREYNMYGEDTGNITTETIPLGSSGFVDGFGWNGVVLFIFTGTQWVLLIHNIKMYLN